MAIETAFSVPFVPDEANRLPGDFTRVEGLVFGDEDFGGGPGAIGVVPNGVTEMGRNPLFIIAAVAIVAWLFWR